MYFDRAWGRVNGCEVFIVDELINRALTVKKEIVQIDRPGGSSTNNDLFCQQIGGVLWFIHHSVDLLRPGALGMILMCDLICHSCCIVE